MTEIEKMFKNANAYKMLCNCEFKNLYDYRIEYGSDVCDYTESKIKEPCNICKKVKQKIKYYPDFTAKKQLELIKWLSTKELKIRTNKQPYAIYIGILGNDNTCFFGCEGLYFEQTLAEVINNLWQDLTDQEKEEIRGILNE